MAVLVRAIILVGTWKTNLDVGKAICGLLVELRLCSVHKPFCSLVSFVEDRHGYDLRYAIEASKILRNLNCQPQ